MAIVEEDVLADIAIVMSKHVENWPQPKKVKTAIALIDKTLAAALSECAELLDALKLAVEELDDWSCGEADTAKFHALILKAINR